jgi:hypothetical protein
VDIAFHEAGRKVSLGCCVRDSNGRFITGQTRWKRLKVSLLEGEAMALLEAIMFVSSKGWHNVIFESDSYTLVNSLSSQCNIVSEFYMLLSVINDKLSLHSNFEVKFIQRQANMVAHSLAKAASS